MPIYNTTTVKSVCTFLNDSDAAYDPTTVTCTVTAPNSDDTTYAYGTDSELTKTSTGVYQLLFDADAGGDWYVRWYGANTDAKVTEQDVVRVKKVV